MNEPSIGAIVAGAMVYAIFGLGIASWVQAIVRWKRGQPLLAWEPRRQPPWGLFDLIAAVLLVVLGWVLANTLFVQFGWLPRDFEIAKATIEQKALLMLAQGGSQLLVLPVLLGLISVRTGATLRDYGLVARRFGSDIKLGAIAFTMLLPLVFVIQLVVTQFWKYEHDVLDVLTELSGWQWRLGMAFVAGVSAPIAEEVFMRLLLQGWLEKVICFRGPTHELVLGPVHGQPAGDEAEPFSEAGAESPAARGQPKDAADLPVNPYEAPVAAAVREDDLGRPGEFVPLRLRRWGWAPIGVTSLLFALLHWQNGPAWIALTVLAVGLGFLYQRTHRLVPSIVVHAMLNNMTILLVLVSGDAAKA